MARDELRQALDKDELDYPALATEVGPEALDDLEALVAEDEPRIASKAAYLAALVDAERGARIVQLAAESRHDVVRASAAAAVGSLQLDKASPITQTLLSDPDPGIRARAIKSAAQLGGDLHDHVRRLADDDDDPEVRQLAAGIVD